MITLTISNLLEGELIYVYPDMRTVLVGKFKDGAMMEARQSKIIAERCNDGIKEIKISPLPKENPVFSFKRNNRLRIHAPTIMDPFEKNTVYVQTTEGRGEGLFAHRTLIFMLRSYLILSFTLLDQL